MTIASSGARRHPGLAVFFLAFFWFLLWGRSTPPSGDERETLEVARGLAYLGKPMRYGVTRWMGLQAQPGQILPEGVRMDRLGMNVISKYGIGQSLVDLPGVFLDKWFGGAQKSDFVRVGLMQLPGILLAAFSVWLVFAIARRLEIGPRRSILIALAAAFASPLWVYSRTLFADLTVATCTFGAIWAALRFETGGRRWTDALLAGAFLGFAAITKIGAVISVPIVGLFGLWVSFDKKGVRNLFSPDAQQDKDKALKKGVRNLFSSDVQQEVDRHLLRKKVPDPFFPSAAAFLLPLAAAAGWILLYNHLRFGRWLETGYWQSADDIWGFGVPLWAGLYGMLFSSGKSLFLYTPLLIAALFGWPRLLRRRPAAGTMILGVAAAGMVFYAFWWAWHGDWAWAIRHILYVPLLGLLGLGEVRMGMDAPSRTWRRWARAVLGLLALAGLWVNLLGVLVMRPLPFYLGSTQLETPVFKEPLFREGEWDIRDDFMHFHFIPEFSPIAVNWWLVESTWNRDRWTMDEIAGRAPWMRLNRAWKPRIDPGFLFYDTWWSLQWSGGHWGTAETLLLAVLLIGLAFSAIDLRRSARPRAG